MRHLSIVLLFLCAACATTPKYQFNNGEACSSAVATLDADFAAGAMAGCYVDATGTFTLKISPEDTPINPSPWYAFRLSPKQAGVVSVTLVYDDYKHRYFPKMSEDLHDWMRLDVTSVAIAPDEKSVTLTIPVGEEPLYVAGQEIVTSEDYKDWMRDKREQGLISVEKIGATHEGRAIISFQAGNADSRKTVFLVGRQHPPEVTGQISMMAFMDSVLGDSKLAQNFRAQFNLIAIPLINADGVEHGYWRHNMGSTDLNRDWGPFTQPETQAIKTYLDNFDAAGTSEMVLFLDFHSTNRNVFYTQTIEQEPTAYDFTGKWLEAGRARLADYEFSREERHNSDLPTSKNYMYSRYNIPAMTYETGDETDREAIRQSSTVFAEEMMRLLLLYGVE